MLPPAPHIVPPYCYRCPLGHAYPGCGVACADDLERTILMEGPDSIAAFIAEPVIGSTVTGVVPVPEYYRRIREICDAYDVLFIADEVLTGYGRTGRWLAIEHWGVEPDIVVMVRRDQALDDCLAPAPAGLDDHAVGLPGDRVGRECHPGGPGVDQLDDADGHRHVAVVRARPQPVGHRARVEQAGPARPDRVEHPVLP